MNTVTEERVRELLGDSWLIDCEDTGFPELVAQANADPNEGAEWLPYYKIALSLLMQGFGVAMGIAHAGLTDPSTHKVDARLDVLRRVAIGLAKLSNLACAVGPNEATPELLAKVNALNLGLDLPEQPHP